MTAHELVIQKFCSLSVRQSSFQLRESCPFFMAFLRLAPREKRKLAPWNLTNLLHFSIARQKKKYCIKDAIYAYFWLLLMHVNQAKSSSSEMEPTSNHILVLKSWSISPPQFKISRYINSQTILEERNAKILLIFIPWHRFIHAETEPSKLIPTF